MKGQSKPLTNENQLNLPARYGYGKLTSLLGKYAVEMALVALIIVATLLQPLFFTPTNAINVLRQVSVTGTLAVAMTFVIINGGIDLSVGSVVGLTGMLVIMLQTHGLVVAIVAALSVGAFVGIINGFNVAKGIAPFIMTLVTMTMSRGVAFILSNGQPVNGSSKTFAFIGGGSIVGIPVPVIIFLVIVLISHFLLNGTVFGRTVYAVGGNAEAARLAGINLLKNRVMVYGLAGLLSAISGIVITARMNACDPTVGSGFELDAIAATVIGGTSMLGGEGKVYRTVVGALIIGVLSNVLNLLNVSPYMQQVAKGLIIFMAVASDTWKSRSV